MEPPVIRVHWLPDETGDRHTPFPTHEWLVTNGLGGYAAGTLTGPPSRRYHGLLIAALPAPLGRRMMFNRLVETFQLPDGAKWQPDAGKPSPDVKIEFRLETGLPTWLYEAGGVVVEKRVILPHGHNTVHVRYRLAEGKGTVRLALRPWVHFRAHGSPVGEAPGSGYAVEAASDSCEVRGKEGPPLRLFLDGRGAKFTAGKPRKEEMDYPVEGSRGYREQGGLWSPGYFEVELPEDGEAVTLLGTVEEWGEARSLRPDEALRGELGRRRKLLEAAHPSLRRGPVAQLVLAADQFLVRSVMHPHHLPSGAESGTVMAGYYWFTDWGRDTMISLEGLTLLTGRQEEAGPILRTFAGAIKDGLIPNLFPEGSREGLYNTADASLWFFHAVDRYVSASGDRRLLRDLLPALRGIAEHYLAGTQFHIHVDADGLVTQGQEGVQLTWMDAKVGDWVVTPRRGKAVEINALWYNALRLLSGWLKEEGDPKAAAEVAGHAKRARRSFNERFWYDEGGYLYDVVDGPHGNESLLRPNQVLALSLRYPVLERRRWKAVLKVVRERLLTPVGLRSLAPGEPHYHPVYFGDRRSRDAAYHQGTVWPWLLGPFTDAWLRTYPDDRKRARHFLDGVLHGLHEAGIGTVSEIFDAEEPYTPRGCVAQAWSVAEAIRCWVNTAE